MNKVGDFMTKKTKHNFLFLAGVALSLGFTLIGSSFVGMYIGSLIDKANSTKIYTPIGLMLGLIVGLHRLWIIIRNLIQNIK